MDIKLELIQSFGKIAVFTMFILSVFLFTVKTRNKLANHLFGIYLLVIAFDLIGFFTTKTMDYPTIQILKTSSSLLQMPLFFFYVSAACFNNFKFTPKHLLHSLPFLLFLFIFKIQYFTKQNFFWYEIAGELQFIAYIIAVFLVLKRYKTIYLENYAKANYYVHKWLFQITILACIAHSFVIARWFLTSSNLHNLVLNINIIISTSVLGITVFFVLNALYKPSLFTGVDMNIESIQSLLKEEEKISKTTERSISINSEFSIRQQQTEGEAKTGVERAEKEDLYEKMLIDFMEQEKPYLDSELTLQKLSQQINTPEKELSIFINHELGNHFFDFINNYRIKDALELLEDTSKDKKTVQEIYFAVGFNSKSSFYTAFKKKTNLTPTQYRKRYVSK